METTELEFPPAESVEQLKNMLVAVATGSKGEDSFYQEVRSFLIRHAEVGARAPQWIRTHRNLAEFWQFIKYKYPTYRERRDFIREEFQPLQLFLEDGTSSVSAETALVLERLDGTAVRELWQRMLDRRSTDPEGAITAARALVESACKHILDDLSVVYPAGVELGPLYALTARQLRLAPEQHTEDVIKRILGGCVSAVDGLATIRNKLSDAHGKGRAAPRPTKRHAELAVNFAGAIASFLVATWEVRAEKGGS